jgi:hypothetical protein
MSVLVGSFSAVYREFLSVSFQEVSRYARSHYSYVAIMYQHITK